MTILVTGAAGFIGYHVAEALLARGETVFGIDNINDYYEVSLKEARLARLEGKPGFTFRKMDIADRDSIPALAKELPGINGIVHLAAQAGVRYSLVNPYAYVTANVMGHLVMMELARALPKLKHMVYASSSSVYGSNDKVPFAEDDEVLKPNSLYAATKRADELFSQTYAHLYNIPQTGLRFFTVYGPWGRPDMAPILFTKAIIAGKAIPVFNNGDMYRDFTYIDDIVNGVVRALDRPPTNSPPHTVYNLGNHKTEKLMDFIATLEGAIGKKADMEMKPMQAGDVPRTYADVAKAQSDLGYAPTTPISEGIPKFVKWYREFYGV
jgi:UDP-glucuronate 4-epimerase